MLTRDDYTKEVDQWDRKLNMYKEDYAKILCKLWGKSSAVLYGRKRLRQAKKELENFTQKQKGNK